MSSLYDKAVLFATKAHEGQERKYTGEPYIRHPVAVAEIIKTVPHTEEMLAAAILHDVVEDTSVELVEITDVFGQEVSDIVYYLTDISRPEHGNRKTRKTIDAKHYARGPAEAQTIKVADLIDNTKDIRKHDSAFWEVYKHEKLYSLELLTKADKDLWLKAKEQIIGEW